ncbi:MAG: acyl--CoA ligase [Nocardioidaceae bacterium]|nr:acyl--CoA ligase [Nocardioidaceae bacterium]
MAATNVAELLQRLAARDGSRVAMVDGERRVTWSELDGVVDDLSRGLATSGLVGGQRVAIALQNSLEFVVTYLACLRGGMVAVPLSPATGTGEVARMLAESGARWCFADASTIATVRGAVSGISDALVGDGDDLPMSAVIPKVAVVGGPVLPGETSYKGLLHQTGPRVSTPLDSEALAALIYTAGTSGHHRPAMLTHRALIANIDQAARVTPSMVTRGDVVLGVLPLSHAFGLNMVLGQVLLHGATLVLARQFDARGTLQLIEAERVTCLPLAAPIIAAWASLPEAAQHLTSVRTVLSGAAPLPIHQMHAFESATGLPVEQCYGLTEAAPLVTSTVGTGRHKPGSVGAALPGVELRVVDPSGRDSAVGDPGEIWMRGGNVFSGYWPDGDGAPGVDGWLRTGDVGFLDIEEDLHVIDRLRELVVVSGFNVYPSEVEEVVREVEGVAECAVIGVPDVTTGEAAVVFVVAADGRDADLSEAVGLHCERRLARFKVPAAVHVVNELLHSATGEVAKHRLRELEARRAMGLS